MMPTSPIPDIQSSPDSRNLVIDKVGIKDLRHPIRHSERSGGVQTSIGLFTMAVRLPAHLKGTHMSRFVALLQEQQAPLSPDGFGHLVRKMADRLEADSGSIAVRFPYFIDKTAPVSGVASLLDYEVHYFGELVDSQYDFTMQVQVPVTSLCPCSKEISQYGAHNQRSHVTVTAKLAEPVWVEELIELVEQQASCELYGLLKRPDEKYVTERAYENPKFVEDMVRDVAARLNDDARILAYTVESENFESIHNHSAYALIEHDKYGG